MYLTHLFLNREDGELEDLKLLGRGVFHNFPMKHMAFAIFIKMSRVSKLLKLHFINQE